MNTIRTIIVDDEPLARSRIAKLLDQITEVVLVGEARNGQEAVNLIDQKKPDLVLLDIQMPDMDGFEVVRTTTFKPFVIFITAYDQYALKAFDVHAVDYLLKPYDNARFFEALQFAQQQITLKQSASFNDKMMALVKEYQVQTQAYTQTLVLKEKGRDILIEPEEIYYAESYGNYVKLHLDNRFYLYRSTMQAIENQLNPRFFIRIHRSYLVHSLYIRQVTYEGNAEYTFLLKNGAKLLSGRKYKAQVLAYLEG
ncbi:hypothetical protein BKI52_09165 [marine bacterium AO1-C]|nr:hypothetical protein BKI52_09165 [marine bacterium AO1-C]